MLSGTVAGGTAAWPVAAQPRSSCTFRTSSWSQWKEPLVVRGSRGPSSAQLTVTAEKPKVLTSETDSLKGFTWWTGDRGGGVTEEIS